MAKTLKSIRISDNGNALLEALCAAMGLTQAGVMEQALRELAKREGVPVPGVPPVAEPTAKDAD